jgi:hypothetical protein
VGGGTQQAGAETALHGAGHGCVEIAGGVEADCRP